MSNTQVDSRGGRGTSRGGHGGRGGGRGRFHGRSYTGPYKQKALIESLPFLSFSSTRGPELTFEFLESLKTYVTQHFLKDMDMIFDVETEPRYPEREEPQNPDNQRDLTQVKKWEISYKEYRDWSRRFEEDKAKIFGVILGQITRSSRDRIDATAEGKSAITNKDPLSLVKVILSTHFTGSKADPEENFYAAEKTYMRMSMYDGETLADYHRRFSATLESIRESARVVDKTDKVPDEAQVVIHFVYSLNSHYTQYENAFRRSLLRTKPLSLQEAYESVTSFGDDRAHSFHGPQHHHTRGVFSATRGGRGRQTNYGESGRGGRKARGGRGACHKCGQFGHWKNDCPVVDKDADKDVEKALKEKEKQKN